MAKLLSALAAMLMVAAASAAGAAEPCTGINCQQGAMPQAGSNMVMPEPGARQAMSAGMYRRRLHTYTAPYYGYRGYAAPYPRGYPYPGGFVYGRGSDSKFKFGWGYPGVGYGWGGRGSDDKFNFGWRF